MNLVIDCIALPKKFAGAAYYIINLAKNLLNSHRTYDITIICKKEHQSFFKNDLKNNDQIKTYDLSNRLLQLLFYEFHLQSELIRLKTDIFLATHYITPKFDSTYKIISIFHDAGFFLHPHYYSFIKRVYFKNLIPLFLKRSIAIVTVSKATQSDMAKLFPEHKHKMKTIYPGTDHTINIEKDSNENFEQPFALAVNAFEARKNIPFILEVFKFIKEKYNMPHHLYLAGQNGNQSLEIESVIKSGNLQQDISILNNTSGSLLSELYRRADFFINTSQYEGFGFTPFEALKHNCPVFIYKNQVVEEIFNEYHYVFDHQDAHKWAEKIYTEYKSGFKQNAVPAFLKDLTWKHCASEFNKLIESTA